VGSEVHIAHYPEADWSELIIRSHPKPRCHGYKSSSRVASSRSKKSRASRAGKKNPTLHIVFLGTRPYGLNPFTKAHIYKTFCLPKALYGLGVITVPDHLLQKLERIQNDVLRSTLGLSKYNHLSEIKEVLGIQTIEHSYLKYKCSLIGLLKRHPLSNSILQLLISENYPDNKLSLRHDFKKIRDITNLSLSEIYSNPNMACEILSQKLKQRSLTSEIRPKIEKISEFLADFTPTNMVKLRELTFVFNATPVE
jgi:hypothetical protein